jgi:hypothetical protein
MRARDRNARHVGRSGARIIRGREVRHARARVDRARTATYARVRRCSVTPLRRRMSLRMGGRRARSVDSLARPRSPRARSSRSRFSASALTSLPSSSCTIRAARSSARVSLSTRFLTDVQLSDATTAARCSRCRDPISYAEWRELKHAMLYELERRPAGDTVLIGLEEWPLAQACWTARVQEGALCEPGVR